MFSTCPSICTCARGCMRTGVRTKAFSDWLVVEFSSFCFKMYYHYKNL